MTPGENAVAPHALRWGLSGRCLRAAVTPPVPADFGRPWGPARRACGRFLLGGRGRFPRGNASAWPGSPSGACRALGRRTTGEPLPGIPGRGGWVAGGTRTRGHGDRSHGEWTLVTPESWGGGRAWGGRAGRRPGGPRGRGRRGLGAARAHVGSGGPGECGPAFAPEPFPRGWSGRCPSGGRGGESEAGGAGAPREFGDRLRGSCFP